MAKLKEVRVPRIETLEDARRFIEELVSEFNKVVRALNILLPP